MSIKLRLFLILILATGAVWLSAVVWIQASTRADVERVLDARLAESANMVSSLVSDQRIAVGGAGDQPARIAMGRRAEYSKQLSCQIWSLRGDLVGASSGAPDAQLATTDGFSRIVIDGEAWRVYSVSNTDLGVRVAVGDRMSVRDGLVYDVVEGLLLPALVIVPVLALLIWISVGRGLAPLERLESALRTRSPADLSPLPNGPAPREIRPVRRALNSLFVQLDRVRRTERDFTTFAAHELKTPLAGMRTQAQIARIATDDTMRDNALAAIQTSVDRTDRLVRQMLELASVDGEELQAEDLNLADICKDVIIELQGMAARRAVGIETQVPEDLHVLANGFLLFATIRNVVENAVIASPADGRVTIHARKGASDVTLTITDEGRGIAAEDRDRVTQRFFRGGGAGTGGSGLGLSIAASAIQRIGGDMAFPGLDHGQAVEIRVPLCV